MNTESPYEAENESKSGEAEKEKEKNESISGEAQKEKETHESKSRETQKEEIKLTHEDIKFVLHKFSRQLPLLEMVTQQLLGLVSLIHIPNLVCSI